MEIGQKVKWKIDKKIYEGLFIQITDNGKVEVICYLMNNINCRLRVFVEPNLIKINRVKTELWKEKTEVH